MSRRCATVPLATSAEWAWGGSLWRMGPTFLKYFLFYLARSAKVAERDTERAIYFTLRNFLLFYYFFIFLMISWRQIISRSAEPIFTIFTSNESFLAVDDRSGPLFSISQGTLPWQPILCKKWQTPHFRRSGIQKRYEVTPCMGRIK